MIPSTFVKICGEALGQSLFLKTPNGAQWKLSLEKHDGKIWFHKGWKEFANFHSLVPGHLLIFRYQRTSHFGVHIFDRSALEIDYPLQKIQGEVASNDKGDKHVNDENLKHHRSGQKRKDKSPLEQPCKGSSKSAKAENTMNLSKATQHHSDNKGKAMNNGEQVTAVDRASCFRSCNPYFKVVMYLSNVRSLNFPTKFWKRHIDLQNENRDMNLEVLNGRVWPVRYRIRESTTTRFELSNGWRRFAKDNNLKVGDVCIFELITATKLTFQVHIFRDTDNSNC